MRPMLRFGSRGDLVLNVQRALNARTSSKLPSLTEDGIFGALTAGKVKEYQHSNQLSGDAIIGPKTWAKLGPLVDEVLKNLVAVAENERLAGERIVSIANSALASFGWPGKVTLNPASPRIAAALCADPDAPNRPRQGGRTLQHIFMIAGAPGHYIHRCPTISKEAEHKWQQSAQGWRNGHDLPAWCGIFAFYVYRCAGINLPGGWAAHNYASATKRFHNTAQPKEARKGSIGVIDGIPEKNEEGQWVMGRNHHFLVVDNDPGSGVVNSIDGNCYGPLQSTVEGNRSVIARRRYSYTDLKAKAAYFLFPKLSD